MTEDVMRWYLLNPEGQTVSEVICSPGFVSYRALEEQCDILVEYEVALMDRRKVEFHLANDAALQQWLKDRSIHNPFQ